MAASNRKETYIAGKFRTIEMADLSKHEIDAAIVQIVAIASRHKDRDCVVPIFITDKENTDAYYRLKFGLLRNDIPVQVVTAKLIANRSSLKWSVANIALQIFSKAGGTAWHVQPCTKDCLIFGIGQAHKKEGRFVRRYFAYSVCTDSSGAYKRRLLDIRVQVFVDLGDHPVDLCHRLRRCDA